MKAKEKPDQKKRNKAENNTFNASEVKKQEKVKLQFCKAHRSGMTVEMIRVTVTTRQQ